MKVFLVSAAVFSNLIYNAASQNPQTCVCNARSIRQLYEFVDDSVITQMHRVQLNHLQTLEDQRVLHGKKGQSDSKICNGKKSGKRRLGEHAVSSICSASHDDTSEPGDAWCDCKAPNGTTLVRDTCWTECCLCILPKHRDAQHKVPRRLSEESIVENNTFKDDKELGEDKPWVFPSVNNAKLIASDPGIWEIPHFIEDSLADKVIAVIKRHGDDQGLFGPCDENYVTLDEYGSIIEEEKRCACHPKTNKRCMRYWPTRTSTTKEDEDIMVDLMNKIKSSWAVRDIERRDYFGIQQVMGGCGPMDYHTDAIKSEYPRTTLQTVTLTLYLTSGSANLLFPGAKPSNLTYTPKKGTAITWLNTHADGGVNMAADHGVQATPYGWDERMMLHYRFTVTPEELVKAAAKFARD